MVIANANAGIQTAFDPKVVGEQCRKQAIILDSLSRYQDRALCSTNLDGGKVYFASQYILANRNADAKALLDVVMIQIKFAIDIGCYGQADMKDALGDIQRIRDSL